MSKVKTFVFKFSMIIVILFLLLIGISTFVASYFKNNIVLPPQVVNVSVIEISKGDYVGDVKSSGFLKSNNSGNLFTQVSGKVDKIFVKPGAVVKKDQVILQLDIQSDLNALQALKSNLNVLRLNYEGLQKVYKEGGASKVQVEQAKASYNQLLSQVKANQEAIDKKKIIAPFDGVVGSINTALGNLVQAGQTLVTIIPNKDSGQTFINLGISPDLLDQLSVGNKASIVDNDGKPIYNGYVAGLDRAVTVATGLSKARVEFNNPNLLDGQFVKVSIETNPLVDRIIIPDISIYYSLYGQTVYKIIPLNDNDLKTLQPLVDKAKDSEKEKVLNNVFKVKEIFIKSNQRFNDIALVDDGLSVGDVIVTNGDIKDGSFVKVIPGYGFGITDKFHLPPYAIKNN